MSDTYGRDVDEQQTLDAIEDQIDHRLAADLDTMFDAVEHNPNVAERGIDNG